MITAILSAEPAGPQERGADYVLAPDVVLLLIQDGTGRLLDLGGNFYTISAPGAAMLYEVLQRDTAAAVHGIAEEYNIEVQHVQSDLRVFLDDLEQKQLIYRRERSLHRDKRRSIVPSLVLMPVLRAIHAWTASVKARAWALVTLAHIAIRLFGWARTLTVWRHYYQENPVSPAAERMGQAARAVDEAVRAAVAGHPFHIGCKERALGCWALIRAEGFSARLVLGVALFPFASHCWCQLGSSALSDDEERCKQFMPVLSYE